MRAREIDLHGLVAGLNTPVVEQRPDVASDSGAKTPPRLPAPNPLDARLRDLRNPHRRRWRQES